MQQAVHEVVRHGRARPKQRSSQAATAHVESVLDRGEA